MKRIKQFIKSLSFAWRGLKYVVRNEKNFQNELAVAVVVISAMFYFQVTRSEMIILFIIITGVLVAEILNTIMERVVNVLEPRVNPYARLIKDLLASSVLLTSILAIVIGLIIFIPYIIKII
jgi:undecaprenol kinase